MVVNASRWPNNVASGVAGRKYEESIQSPAMIASVARWRIATRVRSANLAGFKVQN